MESFEHPLALSDTQMELLRTSASLIDVAKRDTYLRAVVRRIYAVSSITPDDKVVVSAIQLILSNQFGISASRDLLNSNNGVPHHDPFH